MKKLQIIIITLSIAIGPYFAPNSVNSQPATKTIVSTPTRPQVQYYDVNALDIVNNPSRFLRRNIRIKAKFDKFSTLGLDYPPAMRSHEEYISFLIQRPDITNHNIPLSELKIFMKKEMAEKNIDLDAGDEIVFTGKVFSTALGDAWIDVDNIKITNKVKKNEEKK